MLVIIHIYTDLLSCAQAKFGLMTGGLRGTPDECAVSFPAFRTKLHEYILISKISGLPQF